MKSMKSVSFRNIAAGLSLCLIAFAATPAKAQNDPNAVFATVNGEEIKSTQFWHRLAWYRFDPASPMAQLPAGFLTINQLITERLVFGMAKDKGVTLTDAEVQAEIKRQEDADPNLLSDMKSEGRPESDLYEQVKYDLIQYKLKTFGITITDQEVEKHYQDYPAEFTTPKRYKLQVIVVDNKDDATAVDSELAAGKDFGDVASAHSRDVSKENKGEFGVVTTNQLSGPVAQAISTIKIGDVTPWVSGAKGGAVEVKYKLEDIIPSAVQPLTPALRDQIRRKLALDKGDVKNPVLMELNTATLNAKVVINQPGFQKIYDEVIKSFMKAHPANGG